MKNFIKKNNTNRIHSLDEIRGFCIIIMVIYHALFTIGFMFKVEYAENLFYFFMPLQHIISSIFIFLCGISCNLSRSNLKRGLFLIPFAIIITVVSFFFFPGGEIFFGILHFLAVCILLYTALKKLIDKTPTIVGMVICIFLFLLTYNISKGYLGFDFLKIDLPEQWYSTNNLMFLGLHKKYFVSYDYFPLFPWFFVFLFGAFLGKYSAQSKFPKALYKSRVPFLSACGKYTIWIYMLHQPVIYGACLLISFLNSAFT